MIEDDCYFLGVHIRLSTRCKIFFTLKSLSLTPTGVILYARASFPSCVWLSHPFVVRAISSILKLLEFLRCDAPVSQTLAWWQRLLTHVSHESSYPVVDWGNSYKPLFSSQGEYRFTFSYRHIMNSNRAPKQWSLTKNETITTFEAWRKNLQYSLSLDANFAQFLVAEKVFYCSQQRTRVWWRRRSYHSPTYCLSEKLTLWANVGPDSQLLPRYFT